MNSMLRRYLRSILTAACTAFLADAALAQHTVQTMRSEQSEVEYVIANNGILAHDQRTMSGGFFYPRGSGRQYLYAAGLWIGARKRVEGKMVPLTFLAYDPSRGSSWAEPGDGYV